MKKIKTFSSLVLTTSLLLTVFSTSVSAEDVFGTLQVESGSLSLEAPNKSFYFDNLNYHGGFFYSFAMFDADIVIKDFRTNGEGWKIYVQATPLKEVKQPGSSLSISDLRTAPTGSVRVGKELWMEDEFGGEIFGTDWDKVSDLNNDYVTIDNGPYLLAEVNSSQATGTFYLKQMYFGILIPSEFPINNPRNVNQNNGLTEYYTTITFTIVSAP